MNARRDAIADVIEEWGDASTYESHHATDVILALPIEKARDRVIEAARAFAAAPDVDGPSEDALWSALAELDALERE